MTATIMSLLCLCFPQHPPQPESKRVLREGWPGRERQGQLLGGPPGLCRRLREGRLSKTTGTPTRTRQRKRRQRERAAVRLPLQSGIRADDAASDRHGVSPVRVALSRRRRHCADAGLRWHRRKFDDCERSRHARRAQRDGNSSGVPRSVPVDAAIVPATHQRVAGVNGVYDNVEQSPAGADAVVDDVLSQLVHTTLDANVLFGFCERVRAL